MKSSEVQYLGGDKEWIYVRKWEWFRAVIKKLEAPVTIVVSKTNAYMIHSSSIYLIDCLEQRMYGIYLSEIHSRAWYIYSVIP